MSPRKLCRLFLAIPICCIMVSPATAGELNVRWDPSAGADGYRVYYGSAPGDRSNSSDVGNVTETNIDGLADCTTWYFAATAYNTAGESAFSVEVSSWPRAILTTVAPSSAEQGRQLQLTLSGINFQAGSTVAFSNPGIVIDDVTVDSCNQATLDVTVGAAASTGSSDIVWTHPNGVSGTGAALFTVETADPPTVVSTTPSDGATGIALATQPTIQFSEPLAAATVSGATVRLLDDVGDPVSQSAGSPTLSADGTLATISPAAALDEGRTYRIEVLGGASGVHDLAGHPMASTYSQPTGFETIDNTSPTVTAVQAVDVTATTALITWTTDENADSQVFYRKPGATVYQQTSPTTELVTDHQVLLQGLAPASTYEYHVRSADSAGNETTTSPDQSFTTADSPYSYLVFEAEFGRLVAPVAEAQGAAAFGGAWIETGTGGGDASPDNPRGTATFGVHLPAADTWYFWVRLYDSGDPSDTWYESIDGAARQPLSSTASGLWTWEAARSYVLGEGLHTVELGGLETGARADRLLLTNDPDFVPTEQPGADITPPGAVGQLIGTSTDAGAVLSWVNPADADYERTIVRYRTDGLFPVSSADGFAVVEDPAAPGSPATYTHSGLTNGVTYSYSVFAVDASGNVSQAAHVEVTPASQASVPDPPTNLRVL